MTMTLPLLHSEPRTAEHPLAARLRRELAGDVRFDALIRTIFSTDASIYEIIPTGVVFPRSVDDVVRTVRACAEAGVPVVGRGGGTGLAGGAIGSGLIVDFSRHMQRIGRLDVEARTVEVEPGVVLDELNAALAPHGLHFAPDVATSSRATIGGMIANNSCGAHSVVFGRTVDHVTRLDLLTAEGELVSFGDGGTARGADRRRAFETRLAELRDENFDEIDRRFPKILRSNGGYGLDRLGPPGMPADAIKILCGSEGTLGIIVGATLRLTPLPKRTGLVVLHYGKLLDSLGAVPAILAHKPAAVELVDRLILHARHMLPAVEKRCHFLEGDPEAILVVEFYDEDEAAIAARVDRLLADAGAMHGTYATRRVLDRAGQADVWNLRKAGLGLLLSRPGDVQPYDFVEDTAVDPTKLRDYIEKFMQIVEREGISETGYFAHASVGCLHVHPAIRLKTADDVEQMRRIADAVCSLVIEFGGAMTAEHGEGILRSSFIERMYGPQIVAVFREVKRLFDPHNRMNPGKIVDPLPMTANLRHGPTYHAHEVKTHLDFSAHGGMAGLASMCSGVGQCRQRLTGTMCPSYQATGDERHTTRARANALRVALSDRGLLHGLDDPHLAEVMDLCLACKACKSECPTGVDMAKLKYEYLARRNLREGVPPRARMFAMMPARAALAVRMPRIANFIAQSGIVRRWMERTYGIDSRIPPPRFATQTFRTWFARHARSRARQPAPRGPVVYFVDTWTNYFLPSIGVAAVRLLEAAGFEVLCPRVACCGRPAISQGLLAEAKRGAEANVRLLARLAREGVPIVGTEPSCILTLCEETPQFVPTPAARHIAGQSMMIESFLARLLELDPAALQFRDDARARRILYHGHCHQKAQVGTEHAVALMRAAFGDAAREIPSGCCGMAGAFGHEVEHYDVAQAVGEHRLFPAVRERGDAAIAVSGFSCRHQIEHHTHAPAVHLVEHLAAALA
jgi:FAD/FMN-containing dehydrogenase/Fe-S oxidoreductase